ncbi:general transcription factor 3C polypeptide 2 [Nematostella vectensis]|uniref:general transcription factor 3C polypeptide 2 n=1 Tax=Nematostella vectensis TaxID=45351 RepID=UPI002076F42C|nr:general transcription factor 3C polypeptide 2 [Nematostella vectensis]
MSSNDSDLDPDLDVEELKNDLQASGKVSCPSEGCNDEFMSLWGLKFHLKKGFCNKSGDENASSQGSNMASIEDAESIAIKNSRKREQNPRQDKDSADVTMVQRRSGRKITPRKKIEMENIEPKKKKEKKSQEVEQDSDVDSDGDSVANEDDIGPVEIAADVVVETNTVPGQIVDEVSNDGDSLLAGEDNKSAKKAPGKKRQAQKKTDKAAKNPANKEENVSEENKSERQIMVAKLKKQIKTCKYVKCPKCGRKYTTALGCAIHFEKCGTVMEAREKLKCEECGKGYTTKAGLRYHMNAAHSEPVEEVAEADETNKDTAREEMNETTGRRQRKSASRAMAKVKAIAEKTVLQVSSKGKGRESYLDKFIKQLRPDIMTPELRIMFRTELSETRKATCPNKDCGKSFNTYDGIRYHLANCGYDSLAYVCILCQHDSASLTNARRHISSVHTDVEEDHMTSVLKEKLGKQLDISNDDDDARDHDFVVQEEELVEVIEEDEEEESNMEDVVEEEWESEVEEETHVWSDHFQKFVKRGKRGTPRSRVGTPRSRVGTPGGRFLLSSRIAHCYIKQTSQWRDKFLTWEEVLMQFVPTLANWMRTNPSEIPEYSPEATASLSFHIERAGKKQVSTEHQLAPLTGLSLEESGEFGDRTFYVGGPVWAMSWCPVPDKCNTADQYLLIAAHRSHDKDHKLNELYREKGLLQLWNMGKLDCKDAISGNDPHLSLSITHGYGPIWQASWCPVGAWQPPDTVTEKKGVLPRLGLLALACGDGVVKIISVPHPDILHSQINAESVNGDKTGTLERLNVFMNARSSAELVPAPLGTTYNGTRGQAFCVDWSQGPRHGRVAAGFYDGTICLWNLETESPLLRDSGEDGLSVRLSPYIYINAHAYAVRHVAWCETDSSYLVSGGCVDKLIKVWNLQDVRFPVHSSRKGQLLELTWPSNSPGFIFSEDKINSNKPGLRLATLSTQGLTSFCIDSGSAIWGFSVSPWMQLDVSVTAAGEVRLKKRNTRNGPFTVYSIDIEEKASADGPANQNSTKENQNGGTAAKASQANKTKTKGTQATTQVSQRSKIKAHASQSNQSAAPSPCGVTDESTRIATYAEALKSYRLVFKDENAFQFADEYRCERSAPRDPQFGKINLEAIHKVRWNPNKQAATWLATGGAAGLVRVHLVKRL